MRQAKTMCDVLVCGVNSDEDVLKTKGPTIFNIKERTEIVRHCKFVDEIVPNTKYTPDEELLDKLNCSHYAHGDDPAINADGQDICELLKE